jgi:hypothetical protein
MKLNYVIVKDYYYRKIGMCHATYEFMGKPNVDKNVCMLPLHHTHGMYSTKSIKRLLNEVIYSTVCIPFSVLFCTRCSTWAPYLGQIVHVCLLRTSLYISIISLKISSSVISTLNNAGNILPIEKRVFNITIQNKLLKSKSKTSPIILLYRFKRGSILFN